MQPTCIKSASKTVDCIFILTCYKSFGIWLINYIKIFFSNFFEDWIPVRRDINKIEKILLRNVLDYVSDLKI